MSYPCDVIRDLLALYLDDVCSEESRKAVETHLASCKECASYFKKMQDAQQAEVPLQDAQEECRKASSLRAVKRKIRYKQFAAAAAAVLILLVAAAAVKGVLKNSVQIVDDTQKLSVSMVDGSIVGRLYGGVQQNVKLKRVSMTENGQQKEYLFYMLAQTRWDELITPETAFSEYMICPKEKGAEQIDAVYYYTGDYTGIESMNAENLQQNVLANAECLWKEEK